MIFWIDAQLPPALAVWLIETFKVEAISLRELGLRDARDREIFMAARQRSAVVVSKDSDFVDLVEANGPPPQVLWVTCGNASNERLRTVFSATFAEACRLLGEGRPVVEIADALN